MKTTGKIAVGILSVAGAVAIAFGLWFLEGGVGARQAPGPVETRVARTIRRRVISLSVRRLVSPVSSTPAVLEEGRSHFADHCASCHGNDGKGVTEIGQNLYPRVPDMTLRETQELSDGELFFIIKNGVRLTGMPAWGSDTPEDDLASWKLVLFLRHLPSMTTAEVEQMKGMNPVSPIEAKEQDEVNDFLEGHDNRPPSTKLTPAALRGH